VFAKRQPWKVVSKGEEEKCGFRTKRLTGFPPGFYE
jgi:hypothetical protein